MLKVSPPESSPNSNPSVKRRFTTPHTVRYINRQDPWLAANLWLVNSCRAKRLTMDGLSELLSKR
jgi:hypothetical protein